MNNNFAVFITSHRSPEMCRSYVSLRDCGYTGKIYIVVDDLDPDLDMYAVLEDEVLVFNKMSYVQALDTGLSVDNAQLSAVLYAREAVEDFAKQLGLNYFVVLDDDITGYRIRYPVNNKLISAKITNMDYIFECYINLLSLTNICCLSFANDGSFIGGVTAFDTLMNRRSCHTIFIRDVSKTFKWSFAVNEDYISSLRMAQTGQVLFTLPFIQRMITGINNRKDGGMSEVYATTSDFQRAFFATVARPDVSVPKLYKGHFVISINKQGAYPKIISDCYKKGNKYATIYD